MNWAFDLATNTGWAVGRQCDPVGDVKIYSGQAPKSPDEVPSGVLLASAKRAMMTVDSGAWDLRPRRGDGPGMRAVLLRRNLNDLLGAYGKPELVTYEDCIMQGQAAREILYGLRMTLQGWCEENKIGGYRSVNTTSLKGFAHRVTGLKGKLKELDCAAATILAGREINNNDEADAILLLFSVL